MSGDTEVLLVDSSIVESGGAELIGVESGGWVSSEFVVSTVVDTSPPCVARLVDHTTPTNRAEAVIPAMTELPTNGRRRGKENCFMVRSLERACDSLGSQEDPTR